jgi:hypothetical protein
VYVGKHWDGQVSTVVLQSHPEQAACPEDVAEHPRKRSASGKLARHRTPSRLAQDGT